MARRDIAQKIARLRIDDWSRVEMDERRLRLVGDETARRETSRLDGCYVIKTDLPHRLPEAQTITADGSIARCSLHGRLCGPVRRLASFYQRPSGR